MILSFARALFILYEMRSRSRTACTGTVLLEKYASGLRKLIDGDAECVSPWGQDARGVWE